MTYVDVPTLKAFVRHLSTTGGKRVNSLKNKVLDNLAMITAASLEHEGNEDEVLSIKLTLDDSDFNMMIIMLSSRALLLSEDRHKNELKAICQTITELEKIISI